MNATHHRIGLFVAQAALLCAALGAQRDIVVHPPIRPHWPVPAHVRATDLRVVAEIRDGVATTDLHQTLFNDGHAPAEATWILPLPVDSTADHFTMTVGGKEIEGEVLDPHKARSIYESIVRRMRDPGLLEYMGNGCLRARVFPIPPKGSIDVRVRYRQVLPHTAGLHTFVFPLRAAGLPGKPVEKLSLDLTIHSRKPIKNVYSPLQGVDIVRKGDHEARVSLERHKGRMPERDLEVFYGLSADAFGMDLLAWRKKGEAGHFLLMVTPKSDWPEPKNTIRVVQFVLDTSGSMQGRKIEQARNALRFFVRSLKPADRFNIVPFSTEARPFFDAPAEVNDTSIGRAMQKIDEIEARGGTNIEDALRVALGAELPKPGVPVHVVPIVVFLTDGQPTVGKTKVEELLALVKQHNGESARVFVFGVGDDVNTRLCDKIALESNGERDYVREHEDIEVKTGALFTKLSNPVLTGVSLSFDGLEVEDAHPKKLQDLFKGSRLLVVGRYRGDGHHAVRLKGTVDGTVREYVYEADFPAEAGENAFVGTLWAQRKVAVLLDAIRLNGESAELRSEIQRLGREYGIVTPYTSHLIVEEGMQIARARGIVPEPGQPAPFFLGGGGAQRADAERLRREYARAGAVVLGDTDDFGVVLDSATREAKESEGRLAGLAGRAPTGGAAVDESVRLYALRSISGPATPGAGDRGRGVELITHRIGGRTFYLAGGVWIDRAYRPAMRGSERKVEAFSDEYFALLSEHPELAKVFAFSTRIVVVVDGTAIEIA